MQQQRKRPPRKPRPVKTIVLPADAVRWADEGPWTNRILVRGGVMISQHNASGRWQCTCSKRFASGQQVRCPHLQDLGIASVMPPYDVVFVDPSDNQVVAATLSRIRTAIDGIAKRIEVEEPTAPARRRRFPLPDEEV